MYGLMWRVRSLGVLFEYPETHARNMYAHRWGQSSGKGGLAQSACERTEDRPDFKGGVFSGGWEAQEPCNVEPHSARKIEALCCNQGMKCKLGPAQLRLERSTEHSH